MKKRNNRKINPKKLFTEPSRIFTNPYESSIVPFLYMGQPTTHLVCAAYRNSRNWRLKRQIAFSLSGSILRSAAVAIKGRRCSQVTDWPPSLPQAEAAGVPSAPSTSFCPSILCGQSGASLASSPSGQPSLLVVPFFIAVPVGPSASRPFYRISCIRGQLFPQQGFPSSQACRAPSCMTK